jgi:Ca2+-binding RTX toxin-like protein
MQILPSPVAGYARVVGSGFTAPIDVIGALTLSVNGLGGADSISASGGLAALGIPLVLDGGDGDDTIIGSDGADTIIGGTGNDTVSGGRGSDLILLGDGDDTFAWNPGDGSKTIEGQGGHNTLLFNGANVNENITLSANGTRVRLTRDVANITLDVNGVQTLNLNPIGGADNVVINSLAGTDVTQVNIDLGALGGTGDGQADTVTINGTASPDTINITASAGVVGITGLAAQMQITHSEAANDTLIVNGLDGLDTINVGPGVISLIKVIVNQ